MSIAPARLRAAFRVDASLAIGTGHVMRCLTLADELKRSGVECVFVCRLHEGNLNAVIAARGYQVLALPAGTSQGTAKANAHAHWLGTDLASEVEDVRRVLQGQIVDWLIVDHYALDIAWEAALRPYCRRLMVIDDLADRAHDGDLLLDQSLGRVEADYRALVPAACNLLTGPEFALLRPEFAALRQKSLERRRAAQLQHLLITMGGVDKDNVTGKVLQVLRTHENILPADLRISVVMGPHAPWLDQVRAQATDMPRPTTVVAGVSDMAARMADADLAIGAAGSTSWERCCLGLPSIQIVLAENQKAIAQALVGAGAALAADEETLADVLLALLGGKDLAEQMSGLSRAASDIADGRGAAIVAQRILVHV